MSLKFFKHPILNSPSDYPGRHWELDDGGQPSNKLIESRRRSELITPAPKGQAAQVELELTTEDQGLGKVGPKYCATRAAEREPPRRASRRRHDPHYSTCSRAKGLKSRSMAPVVLLPGRGVALDCTACLARHRILYKPTVMVSNTFIFCAPAPTLSQSGGRGAVRWPIRASRPIGSAPHRVSTRCVTKLNGFR